MKFNFELTEKELRALVVREMDRLLGDLDVNPDLVCIEVKSKQNYKSEWEQAAFRAVYEERT